MLFSDQTRFTLDDDGSIRWVSIAFVSDWFLDEEALEVESTVALYTSLSMPWTGRSWIHRPGSGYFHAPSPSDRGLKCLDAVVASVVIDSWSSLLQLRDSVLLHYSVFSRGNCYSGEGESSFVATVDVSYGWIFENVFFSFPFAMCSYRLSWVDLVTCNFSCSILYFLVIKNHQKN